MPSSRLGPREREQALDRLAGETFDLLVIGGGVTGCGAALDAASRGLSVALVEQRDFASGTSSRSSKLFHGGLRYLEKFEFGLVREALRERGLALLDAGRPAVAIRTLETLLRLDREFAMTGEEEEHVKGVFELLLLAHSMSVRADEAAEAAAASAPQRSLPPGTEKDGGEAQPTTVGQRVMATVNTPACNNSFTLLRSVFTPVVLCRCPPRTRCRRSTS